MTDSFIVTMLRLPTELEPHIRNAAADAIDRLRKERDEARRIACEKQAKINQRLYDDKFYANPVVVMRDWGWDCYGSND